MKPSNVSRVCSPSSPQRRICLRGSDPRRPCTDPLEEGIKAGQVLRRQGHALSGMLLCGVPKTLGAPRHVHADTTRRGAPAWRDDATRLTGEAPSALVLALAQKK